MPENVKSVDSASPLRVVVFTAGSLSADKRVFLTRLASDPLVDLQCLVVDDYQPPLPNTLKRGWRGLRRNGICWIPFIVRKKLESLLDNVRIIAHKLKGQSWGW